MPDEDQEGAICKFEVKMDQEEADIDLIERHLRGELSLAESKAFEQRVSLDIKFAEKVDDYIAIINGIKNADAIALADEVESWEKEFRDGNVKPTVSINPWKKYMIAAAVAVILITTFVFINRPGNVDYQQLFTAYFVPYEDLVTVREGENANDVLAAAMVKYNRKEYKHAIPEFLKYLEAVPDDKAARFYLGISYLADGKPSDAISAFGQLETEAVTYVDHVEWYLALAYLLKEDTDSAKARLQKIAEDPDHDFSKKARQLLSDLQ